MSRWLVGAAILVLATGCSDDGSSGGQGGSNGGSGAQGGSGANGGSSGSAQGGSGAAGGSAGSGEGGSGADGGSGANGGSAGNGTGGSGGSATSITICQAACNSPADCASGTPLYDASHYSCDAGVCVWQGCKGDSDCTFLGNYVCREQYGLPTCLKGCSSPNDCGSGQAYDDADNYSCDNGGCFNQGCNNEAECDALGDLVGKPYACADLGGGSFCFPECNTPADCSNGQPGYTASNYECDQGVCRYTGCNGDSECASLGNYVCR
ncbi:MAG: hypothetical protein AB7K71_21870 [Polyangiaceae bacterium]